MKLILGWLVLTLAVAVTVVIVPGVHVDWSPGAFWVIAGIFALVDAAVGVLLRWVTLPVVVLALGLLSLVVDALVLLVTDRMSGSLHVDGFWAALAGSTVIGLVVVAVERIIWRFESDLEHDMTGG